jgi:hypothetical protein
MCAASCGRVCRQACYTVFPTPAPPRHDPPRPALPCPAPPPPPPPPPLPVPLFLLLYWRVAGWMDRRAPLPAACALGNAACCAPHRPLRLPTVSQVAIGVYPSSVTGAETIANARVTRLSGDPRGAPGIDVPGVSVQVHNFDETDTAAFPGPAAGSPHFEFSVSGYSTIATHLAQQQAQDGYTGPGPRFDVSAVPGPQRTCRRSHTHPPRVCARALCVCPCPGCPMCWSAHACAARAGARGVGGPIPLILARAPA